MCFLLWAAVSSPTDIAIKGSKSLVYEFPLKGNKAFFLFFLSFFMRQESKMLTLSGVSFQSFEVQWTVSNSPGQTLRWKAGSLRRACGECGDKNPWGRERTQTGGLKLLCVCHVPLRCPPDSDGPGPCTLPGDPGGYGGGSACL